MNDPDKPEVQAIHRVLREAILSDHSIVPVTHWFDTSGRDCDPMHAATCVCGADGVGWYAVDLRKFSPAKVH